ncbi:GNAT family N-acetyltransferase [Caulobacter vibrioides]|nr:GNAT family protein [Caulobacter vibrioides]YP_002516100.2 ribosomal-protein-alanine acetyltransferase [Caulobacter vibrioides NA1000]ACL94192.2 ribosomal-protein-alanine acetyltransferase [Caulobacter vibrioides NA1000]ATC30589.1 N-acetyltransferase [Caulobacter vibrioides]QXZ53924.1 GNAT family N-acetyltransferase [Caulobacter vibrioides]
MLNLTADILQGRYVRLEPVTVDHHDELKAAIDCDPASWEIMSVNGCGEGFEDFWGALQGETDRGERIGFAIRRLVDGKVVGTSSYLNIRRLHGGLEIGATFLNPEARSGPVNPESKRLMLGHAFDKAGAIRVELVTDVRNARSQAAIQKLGATKEGVLRNHKVTWTGHVRDTAVFSITDYDWPAIRERLEFRLSETFA